MSLRPLIRQARTARRPVLVLDADPAPAGRVAILSGSFDPLTVGHAALARAALARTGLVVLTYSVRALPKEEGPPPLLGEDERLEAVARFCRARPGLVLGLCSHGLLADQAAAAAERFPGSRIHVAMGSDKVVQLFDPRWYADRDAALGRLFGAAEVLYAMRAGEEGRVEELLARPENARWAGLLSRLDVPAGTAGISSRLVRERLRRGEDVAGLVPDEVRPLLTG